MTLHCVVSTCGLLAFLDNSTKCELVDLHHHNIRVLLLVLVSDLFVFYIQTRKCRIMFASFGRKTLHAVQLVCPVASDSVLTATYKNVNSFRTVMTIQDVRSSLRKVVGASSSFRY